MEWKRWLGFFRSIEVLLLSTLIAIHQVNLIRILDFLRYIQNIAEALVVPIVSLSFGLLFPKIFQPKPILFLILLVLVSFIAAIWLGNYWITMGLVVAFYFLGGLALKFYSKSLSSIDFYAKELMGWIIGSLFAYLLLPFLGAEKIFVLTVCSFSLFFLWKLKLNRFFYIPIISVGLFIVTSLSAQQLNLYNIVRHVPSKRDYLNETKFNGSHSVHSLGAKILDTIWTPYDRIDILGFPSGERSIFFSNQSWSRLPPVEAEEAVAPTNVNLGKNALILGLGSGIEFYFLEKAGFRGIVGIELYQELIELMSNHYAPRLFSRNSPIAGDMRHFLRNTESTFDFILHSSPDLATRIGFSGWPIINESTTYESFQSAFLRLKENGLLAVRSYYKKGNNFSIGIFHSLRNLSPEQKVVVYLVGQEMHDTLKTHHLFVIKNGTFLSSDHDLIQSIYPGSKRIENSSVGDPEFFAEIRKTLEVNVYDLSIVKRDTLLERIKFDSSLMFWSMLFVSIGIAIWYFAVGTAFSSGRLLGVVFFSGIYWAVLELSLITYFSNTFSNSILAFLVVFQGLMFSSWVSNFGLPSQVRGGRFLSIITPVLATLSFALVLFGFEKWNIQPSILVVFLFVFFVGIFGSFNFNYSIRQTKETPKLLAWNLIGFTVGAIISWFLINEGKPDLFINILFGLSFYGILGVFGRVITRI